MTENDFLITAAICCAVAWTTVRVHARWLTYRTSKANADRLAAKGGAK